MKLGSAANKVLFLLGLSLPLLALLTIGWLVRETSGHVGHAAKSVGLR